jgi:hypothetical protein
MAGWWCDVLISAWVVTIWVLSLKPSYQVLQDGLCVDGCHNWENKPSCYELLIANKLVMQSSQTVELYILERLFIHSFIHSFLPMCVQYQLTVVSMWFKLHFVMYRCICDSTFLTLYVQPILRTVRSDQIRHDYRDECAVNKIPVVFWLFYDNLLSLPHL